MDCLSSEDLKEEKTHFALCNTLYRIPVLSSWKCPRSRYDVGWFVTGLVAGWLRRCKPLWACRRRDPCHTADAPNGECRRTVCSLVPWAEPEINPVAVKSFE